jgi:hypothetical protein
MKDFDIQKMYVFSTQFDGLWWLIAAIM